jgi:uncharacterized cupin superfamily protein
MVNQKMRDRGRVRAENEAEYQPYCTEGTDPGEIQLIRQRASDGDTPLFVGLYRCAEAFSGATTYAHDESFYVLAGEASVSITDGPELQIGPGEMATFKAGSSCTYTQSAGFKKFFVING